MDSLIIKEVKFYKIDEDNEIEIEREGWSTWLSIEETQRLVDFLNIQLEQKKENESFKSE